MNNEIFERAQVLKSSLDPVTQVSGTYRIHEYTSQENEQKLLTTPFIVTVKQEKHAIDLQILNDETGEIYTRHYPMIGTPVWDAALNASTLTQASEKGFYVDIHHPLKEVTDESTLTTRIVWKKDDQGRIHEFYEAYNPKGSRIAFTHGNNRVLSPIVEN